MATHSTASKTVSRIGGQRTAGSFPAKATITASRGARMEGDVMSFPMVLTTKLCFASPDRTLVGSRSLPTSQVHKCYRLRRPKRPAASDAPASPRAIAAEIGSIAPPPPRPLLTNGLSMSRLPDELLVGDGVVVGLLGETVGSLLGSASPICAFRSTSF